MYELAIVGGGPAGITAAIYAARKMLKFVIITPSLGGELLNTAAIDNYTGFNGVLGPDLAENFEKHLKQYKIEHILDEVNKIEKTDHFHIHTSDTIIEAKAVIITTGSHSKTLNIPGEKELWGRGVSVCATCDGPLYKGKDVAIVGGGNNGCDSALNLHRMVNKISILSKYPELKADAITVQKIAETENIVVFPSATTKSISGSKSVESITFMQDGQEKTIPVQGVFVNIGYLPNTEFVHDLVKTDSIGYIIINDRGETSVPGLFAAGDCTTVPYKQIIIAAGQGAIATLSAYDYITKN